MNRDEVRTKLQSVLQDVFADDTFVFSDTLGREDMDSWDSLGHIRLITATEDAFNLRFTLEEIDKLTSVGRIVETVLSRH